MPTAEAPRTSWTEPAAAFALALLCGAAAAATRIEAGLALIAFVPALLFERTERQGLQRLDSRYDVLPKRGPIDHNPFEERAHLAVAWSEATPDRFRPPTLAP